MTRRQKLSVQTSLDVRALSEQLFTFLDGSPNKNRDVPCTGLILNSRQGLELFEDAPLRSESS